MFPIVKSLRERFLSDQKCSSRPRRNRLSSQQLGPCEVFELRQMLSGTPITGVQVIEQGVTPTTLVSEPAVLTPILNTMNSASVRNSIINTAENQLFNSTNAKLPGGFSCVYEPSVTLPVLNSANTKLTDVINPDGSVTLDMQITGITGAMTINLSQGVQDGIFAALGGPLSPFAWVAFSDPSPSYSFSANIDLNVNLPSPQKLSNAWVADPSLTNFSLPASDMHMTADNIQLAGHDVLANLSLVIAPVAAAATANQSLSISPTVASDVNSLAAGLASVLNTTANDGALIASDFHVTNKSGMLTYTAVTTQTMYLVQNALSPTVPHVSGTHSPVTAQATYHISGQLLQPEILTTPPTYALTTASAPGKHQISMEIDVQNISKPVLLYNVTPIKVGSGWEVKFNTGQTAPLTQSGGFWTFTWPDGVKCNTGFSTMKPPNDYFWTLLTRFSVAPSGTQLGIRQIFLTYDTEADTLTATTSDGLKFNFTGDLWEPITISGSNGYPTITFTVGVGFP